MKTIIRIVFPFLFLMTGVTCHVIGQAYIPAKPFGETKLVNDFICSEVVYPSSALENEDEGKVILSFVVNERGEVSQIRVKSGVSPEIDREAIRVFRFLQWEPAVRLGNPVMTEEEFTFKFNIKKYNRNCKQRGYEQSEFPYLPVDTSYIIYTLNQLDRSPEPEFAEKGLNLEKFVVANLRYPEAAYKQNISGKVTLSFVVETNGRPSNIVVKKPLGGGCTEEALRIMRLVNWMPGIKDEIAVRSRIEMNITFILPNDSDTKVFENNQGAI
jgi:TonB family protein